MKNFHELMQRTMNNGIEQFNTRTGYTCKVVVGEQLTYNLKDGFPAITSKKLAFNSVKGELLGFFRGYDNASDFRKLGCNVWNDNANKTESWLKNPYRKGEDDLGRIYGVQWTEWSDKRIANTIVEYDHLMSQGYTLIMREQSKWLFERKINQLEKVLNTLLTNPSDRRMIVSGWNPAELDMMALPPCHMDYRFVAFENPKVLHVVMTIRSWDEFLGAPFNIASTSLFLAIMARLSGYEPGSVTIQATNAHIYDNHFNQVKEQLTRTHFDAPKLILSDNIKPIINVSDIKGVFERIEPEDITLENYESHASIKAEMAA